VTPTLVVTGQHPTLDPADFGLGDYPRIDLGCAGQQNPHRHVGEVTKALLPRLMRDRPPLLIVQGDTSSALGAALAGFAARLPVAHVEAGLRTHDPLLPWPEEEYRRAIDADAELLFAPTRLAAENLRAERLPGEIHVTGNSGIDALLEASAGLPNPCHAIGPRILVTCHRRESWDHGLPSIAAALTQLALDGAEVEFVLHPNAFVAERMRGLLGRTRGIALFEPCNHLELLRRMRESTLVLSDSGGIQEETPALGIPLLVLRDKTERPEGIIAGASRLVGTKAERIVAEVRGLLGNSTALAAMATPVFPFGDGRASERIAAIIARWLEQRSLTRRLA
jgi:UDP-N-acetylglucosamine 2-epimerase (non-hydrolysing)